MGFKGIAFLGFFLTMIVISASQVAPAKVEEVEDTNQVAVSEAKYPRGDTVDEYSGGGYGGHGSGFGGGGGGGYGGRQGGGGYVCSNGCCRCCSYAGEKADSQPDQAKPHY